ncbi:MAG TPA: glycoside hydrolase family 15 protein, partial [Noviherbaspirillum sp.]|uniref:glycoside hydrolase family 15 protein n=1 Tax=Noviherbaspirillum sp. TaxID=1926288 RepID=UPI002DDCC305
MRYPPIRDYALLSDCHCSALVSRYGSVDWCCMPRVDDDTCFGRLLDWDKGGHCQIEPAAPGYTSTRRYIDGSMILETVFSTGRSEVRLTDFFAMNADAPENPPFDLVRLIDGISGEVEMRVEIVPRFDYGEIIPHVQRRASGIYTAIGSNQGLIIHSDTPLELVQHRELSGNVRIRAGERLRLAVQFEFPERIDAAITRHSVQPEALDRYLHTTLRWWSDWSARLHESSRRLDQQTIRSTVVLKALTYEPTGAIAAASTTSLPEWIGGGRNWDYRFSWVRDSVFTIRALHDLGYVSEADKFHQFTQRSSAGSAEQLQIMYGVDGKRRLTEVELDWLEGYRASRPVRIGNAAARQSQLDMYGELLEMAWQWHRSGHPTDPDYLDFLVTVVETVCRRWSETDHGIWEVRGEPLHYVHSKVMCWVAMNRGIQFAEAKSLDVPVAQWIAIREEIRTAIETRGYDSKRGVFVQAFDGNELDAALLLLPRVGFIAYNDPRMLRTVDALCSDLNRDGLLLRYRGPDGLEGPEGTFLPCTFWLVACLACQGRTDQAMEYYERALSCGNELGLFAEEYDIQSDEMLGNFPQ